ncbi:ubiquinol-cytochrome-c reductase complex assembly factor 6 [Anastrepha obliqua]|uniref:ubiquinol-cytochrome-c reductase complex assembly factor 6 n=1 Tax=Anastrepha obliqua TaxID=95512 RepID=UPI00240A7924|nr:ubiquinol-cytochrome-c reductase complex assembly factor 6 [Anastrepha obliqua]
MPAGVSWGQYMKFLSAAMLSMMAGSQLVHLYYKPLNDINVYIEREMKAANAQNADESPPDGKTLPSKS